MKYFLTLLGFLFLNSIIAQEVYLTDEEQNWIVDHPVVYFGYDPGWKPIEFLDDDGKHSGITSDFLRGLEAKTGLSFEQHPGVTDWSSAETMAKKGELMLLPALAQNERRNEYLNFTDAFFSYSFVIVTQKDAPFIGGVEDLDNRIVAVPKDYYITGLLEQEQADMKLEYYSSIEECLMAVATGQAVATVTNLTVASHYMNYSGYDNLKIAAPTHYPEIDIKMGVIKSEPVLSAILQKGIRAFTPKEKNEIVQNWVSVQYEHGVDMAKVWKVATLCLGVVLLIFVSFVYWNRKLKKEVSLRKEAEDLLRSSFEEITEQKKIIELKNEEVVDSIKYAKRLQEAILPPLNLVDEKFDKNFILYKPKDIVAGDFYWHESTVCEGSGNEVNFIAAADCTGHGVPGAMVSVVCSNALNQAVLQHNLCDPGQILDKTTDMVVERFERSTEEVKDGMDISMVSIERLETGQAKVKYAGAHNNLWVVSERDGIGPLALITEGENVSSRIFEIKANKQPVGKYDMRSDFKTTEMHLEKGDKIYLFTDGFADQFGGENGKKYKSKNFKQLILNTCGLSLNEQKEKLNTAFENWSEGFEQLDDVCVIGIEI